MEKHNEILNELRGIAPRLASLPKVEFISVPENYFVRFKLAMLGKINASAITELAVVAPLLSGLKKPSSEQAPAAFFQSFSAGLLEKVRQSEAANELAQIAPALSKIEKVNSIQVPANYFAGLPAQILAKANKPAKQEQAMPQWMQRINAVLENITAVVFKPRYAFAFAGSATMVLMAVMMFIKVQQCNDFDCKMASISNAELDAYFKAHKDDFNTDVLDYSFDEDKVSNYGDKSEKAIDKSLNQLTEQELNEALLD